MGTHRNRTVRNTTRADQELEIWRSLWQHYSKAERGLWVRAIECLIGQRVDERREIVAEVRRVWGSRNPSAVEQLVALLEDKTGAAA